MPVTPLVVNDIVELRAIAICGGQQVINRFHYQAIAGTPGGPTTDTLQIVSSFQTRWRTGLIPIMYTTYQVYQYFVGVITNVVRNAGPPVTYTITYRDQAILPGQPADKGTLVGSDQLPTFDAMDLQRICQVRNKFSRGSLRISPHDEADQVNGAWDPTRLATVVSAIQTFHTAIGIPSGGPLVTLLPVVFSAANSVGHPYPFGNRSESIVNYIGNPLVSSQVSRKTRNRGY